MWKTGNFTAFGFEVHDSALYFQKISVFLSFSVFAQILKQKMAWVIRQDRAVCLATRPTSAEHLLAKLFTVTPHTVSRPVNSHFLYYVCVSASDLCMFLQDN